MNLLLFRAHRLKFATVCFCHVFIPWCFHFYWAPEWSSGLKYRGLAFIRAALWSSHVWSECSCPGQTCCEMFWSLFNLLWSSWPLTVTPEIHGEYSAGHPTGDGCLKPKTKQLIWPPWFINVVNVYTDGEDGPGQGRVSSSMQQNQQWTITPCLVNPEDIGAVSGPYVHILHLVKVLPPGNWRVI